MLFFDMCKCFGKYFGKKCILGGKSGFWGAGARVSGMRGGGGGEISDDIGRNGRSEREMVMERAFLAEKAASNIDESTEGVRSGPSRASPSYID
jgi:hypothetical protein